MKINQQNIPSKGTVIIYITKILWKIKISVMPPLQTM